MLFFYAGNKGPCRFCYGNLGTYTNFSREGGKKVDSGEQFGISFKGTVQNIFGNKGYF